MRFYLGTSYKLKTKTLIKVLLAIGFLVLATLGLDRANAWTIVNNKSNSFSDIASYFDKVSNTAVSFVDSDDGELITTECSLSTNGCMYYDSDSSNRTTRYWLYRNSSTSSILATKYFSIDTSLDTSTNYKALTESQSIYLKNNDYCTNDNSIDIEGTFAIYSGGNNFSYFPNLSINSLFSFVIIGHDDTNDRFYGSTCTIGTPTTTSGYTYYNYLCESVKTSDTIDTYELVIQARNDRADRLLSTGNRHYEPAIYWNFNTSDYNNQPTLKYECSENDAVYITNDEVPISEQELEQALADAKLNFDTNLPGIAVSAYKLAYPQNFQELISLPLFIIDNIVRNGNTCTDYQIDLTGLLRVAGDNTGTYILELPCMRTKLSSLLGTLYTLIDALMASLVFYNIAMNIIVLVELITNGVDLWTYYFMSKDGMRTFHGIGGFING